MTTLEFMQKQRDKANKSLSNAMCKRGITQDEIDSLKEKVKHYDVVIDLLINGCEGCV